MICPGCDKWISDYSDECWTCGYVFDDDNDDDDCECYCPCDNDDDDYTPTTNNCGYNYVHKYANGAKQCICGKWVPGYSRSCWTCGHKFYC